MTEPVADASQDDALIEASDNSGETATDDLNQDPALEYQSDTDSPPEVTS